VDCDTSIDPAVGHFAARREGYGKAKAVCGLIARPMNYIFFFFLNHITAR
jgi:hypothetical protein